MNNRYREEELNEELNKDLDKDSCKDINIEDKDIDLDNQDINDDSDDKKSKEKPSKKVKKLDEEIKKLKEENQKLRDQYLRTLADAENFKRRIDEERIRERKYGSQRLLEKLIASIDIFDKAVNMKTDDQNLNNFLIGFQMINNNLKQVLEEEGVKKIKTTEKFDPHFHHAVETDYDETKEEGTILMVIKDGYMYKDRVLSPSLVKVNQKPQNPENKDN
ncbi:MAG: nucleotide exchange factor GrpE [Bacilli bacterium]|nr:nucleotide exchange factor GrpE [Bacilli bacterium]